MKNKIGDLRNHLFGQLEKIVDEDLSDEELAKEIKRSGAVANLSKQIIETAKTELAYMKLAGGKSSDQTKESVTKFLGSGTEDEKN